MPETSERETHWDLMLEDRDGLATWSLVTDPLAGEYPIQCIQLPLHRKAYLDYEGPVSGNRGSVRRLDRGRFQWFERSAECVVVALEGKQLSGRFELRRKVAGNASSESQETWMFQPVVTTRE